MEPVEADEEAAGSIPPQPDLSLRMLTPELVAKFASALAPGNSGLSLAYTELLAAGQNLCGGLANVGVLAQLSSVDVSGNQLTSLLGMELLPHLVTLAASDNRLLSVLDFPASKAGSVLRVADLRRNAIVGAVSLPRDTITEQAFGVDAHPHLEKLLLDDNSLRSLRGIEAVTHLRTLSAGSNQLQDTAGLAPLTALRSLDLRSNGLVACDELPSLANLTSLSLATNKLTSLPAGLGASASRLAHLDLRDNKLPSLSALAKNLGGAASPLRSLWLKGNPMEMQHGPTQHIKLGVYADRDTPHALADFRLYALHALSGLHELDGVPASAEDKVAAANHHGADSADLVAIRRAYFPEINVGGTTAAAELPGLLELYKNQYTARYTDRRSRG